MLFVLFQKFFEHIFEQIKGPLLGLFYRTEKCRSEEKRGGALASPNCCKILQKLFLSLHQNAGKVFNPVFFAKFCCKYVAFFLCLVIGVFGVSDPKRWSKFKIYNTQDLLLKHEKCIRNNVKYEWVLPIDFFFFFF